MVIRLKRAMTHSLAFPAKSSLTAKPCPSTAAIQSRSSCTRSRRRRDERRDRSLAKVETVLSVVGAQVALHLRSGSVIQQKPDLERGGAQVIEDLVFGVFGQGP